MNSASGMSLVTFGCWGAPIAAPTLCPSSLAYIVALYWVALCCTEGVVLLAQRHLTIKQLKLAPCVCRLAGDSPPESAEDFIFKKTLGLGSYGQVQLAEYRSTSEGGSPADGRHYAVKILSKAHIRNENQVEHLRNEIETLQLCQHRNLVNCEFLIVAPSILCMVARVCLAALPTLALP